MRELLLAFVCTLVIAGPATAREVYVSVGAHGEVSFSDSRPAGTDESRVAVLEIEETASPVDASARSRALTEELFATAESLAQARLAREAVRFEREAALARVRAAEYEAALQRRSLERYEDHHHGVWFYPRYPRRHHGVRPVRPTPVRSEHAPQSSSAWLSP